MALLVKVDGTTEELEVPKKDSLKFLQSIVGGYIEMAPCNHSEYAGAICDEEGKLKRKPINDVATKMAGVLPYDVLVGDVLFFKEGEVD
jgi:hypothetical protein